MEPFTPSAVSQCMSASKGLGIAPNMQQVCEGPSEARIREKANCVDCGRLSSVIFGMSVRLLSRFDNHSFWGSISFERNLETLVVLEDYVAKSGFFQKFSHFVSTVQD